MLKVLGQIAFAITLMGNMCWAVATMKLIHLFPVAKATKEGMCLTLVQFVWRLTIFVSPWIRTQMTGDTEQWSEIVKTLQDMNNTEDKKRPLFLLSNHTSFFDTIFSVTVMPSSVLWKMRTYMKSDLFNLPLLGTVCHCVGHFPVFFASDEDGVFKVDETKMESVNVGVDKHLTNGGWLCFFPEGQVNKTPDTILPLRYGGFKKACDFDAKLVSLIVCGNPTIWPRTAPVGGFPGKITYSVKTVAPNGAKALAAELRKKASAADKDRPDNELLAEAVQVMMQSQYDILKVAREGKGSIKED